jgi:hypothetical protein
MMKLLIGLAAILISIPVLSDTLTRDQSDAVVDGLKESTRSLLRACVSSEDFARCTQDSGIHCENIAEKSVQDYRCVTRAKIEFRINKSVPAEISEIWEVTFRAFYAGEQWSVGPESITRVGD